MPNTNPGPAVTSSNTSVAATGNLANEWVLSLVPGLTTSIPAASSAEVAVTVQGLQLNDFVEVNKMNHVAGLSVGNARVSAANTLSIQMVNSTAAAIALLVTDQYLLSVERPLAAQASTSLPTSIPS